MTIFNVDEIDNLIRNAFIEFIDDLAKAEWWGKEYDYVNRFAQGYLTNKCSESFFLRHPTQIGIEVGVAQPKGLFVKHGARKDLVIWPEPWMSSWNKMWEGVNYPIAILEWKAFLKKRKLRSFDHDIQWLTGMAKERHDFVGYSAIMNRANDGEDKVLVARFFRDDVNLTWLRI